ncbi:MAG: dUTP diphosphatase [Holosporales bacterium]|jgi:dUTP pyrophosphatase
MSVALRKVSPESSSVVTLQRLSPLAQLPQYATPGAAGADLVAANNTDIILEIGQRALIPTGLAMALPQGFEAQIRPRSGLALKNGVTVLNAPGTIDSDYRGEVQVLLVNHGTAPFTITPGMRIAQMVIAPVAQLPFAVVDSLDETQRGAGGFGSTGLK